MSLDSALETIENLRRTNPGGEYYEVTQLINSLLGFLILIRAKFSNYVPKTATKELRRQGWPIPKNEADYPDPPNLRQFVRYFRNAVAHFNMAFLDEPNTEEITGVRLWNKNTRGEVDWQVTYRVNDLRDFTMRFIKHVLTA